jgi:hypothetical protein
MVAVADDTINPPRASNPSAACADASARSQQAISKHAKFFGSAEHQQKLEAVKSIVDTFFVVRKGMYVNHRANGGNPFSVVKVDNPQFPRLTNAQIDQVYRKPLRDLGVEVVFSKSTNSYLFRVR